MKTSYLEFTKGMEEIKTTAIAKFNSEKEEPYLVINSNTREITVPDTMQNIGVIGDHNAETVWFKIDKFFDRADLGGTLTDDFSNDGGIVTTNVVIQVINAAQEPYIYKVPANHLFSKDLIDDVPNDSTDLDTVIFPWPLTDEVTRASGVIRFSVRIYKLKTYVDNKGTEHNDVIFSYNTQYAQFNILNGLSNIDAPGVADVISPTQIQEIWREIDAIYGKGMSLLPEGTTTIVSQDYRYLSNKPKINGVELVGDIDPGLLLTGMEGDTLVTIKSLDQEVDATSMNAVSNAAIAAKFETIEPIDSIDANSTKPVQSKVIAKTVEDINTALKNVSVPVDDKLSATSVNPVQNRVIYAEIEALREEMGGLSYVPIDILSFAANLKYIEKGRTLNSNGKESISFTWNLTKTPNTLKLNGLNDGAAQPAVTATALTTNSYPAFSSDTTFTLVATDAKNTVSKNFTIKSVHGLYYGVKKITSDTVVNNAFIKGLTKKLSETRETTITFTAGADEYIIFASPVDYGECIFKVGGFEGGFERMDKNNFGYVNDYNVAADYYVYKSVNPNLGTTTVQVL